TVNPYNDIAYLMLDKVFGIPGFFQSCYDPVINASLSGSVCFGYITAAAYPTSLQAAMQSLFAFYSNGILTIAVFIVVYYVFAMLVETINTGRAFGNRYQTLYTPLRLILAVMLIIPMAHGYNLGQYLTLNAAKWGSSMGTNAWLIFNNKTPVNPLGLQPENLAGKPKAQDITPIINFMYLVKSCQAAYEVAYKGTKDIQPYFILDASSTAPSSSVSMIGQTFPNAVTFSKSADIAITFGEKNALKYKDYPGLVKPYCGQIVIPLQSLNVNGINPLYEVHYNLIKRLWVDNDLYLYGKRMAYIIKFMDKLPPSTFPPTTTTPWSADNENPAGVEFYIKMRIKHQALFRTDMDAALNTLRTTPNPALDMDQLILNAGWGGAGLWFNKIASFNGAMTDAMFTMPTPTLYPLIMETIKRQKGKTEANSDFQNRFSPEMGTGSGKSLSIGDLLQGTDLDNKATDINLAFLFNDIYKAVGNAESTTKPSSSNNKSPIATIVTFVLGDTGLFDMLGNNDVFPLAKMAMLGRSIIDKTVTLLGGGALMVGLGGMMGGMNQGIGSAISTMGGVMMSMATMALIAGITLYYIIPLIPFIYFFLAVGRWVKSIFEAMVAVPLWALSHIRLGEGGLVGPAASQGYFMLLEIFLRPILTLFGLLAAVAIFAAMTAGLDTVWSLVVSNIAGFDMDNPTSPLAPVNSFPEVARSGLDELFYTVLYIVVVYMMATSCFKLIDLIPNSVMRWLSFGGRAFSDGTSVDSIIGTTTNIGQNIGYHAQSLAQSASGA
ncbi:MAG: DotA/TraY family protein, partial [Pseudomonadota bacterium]